MSAIQASCGDCGDVRLTTTDVTVRVCTDDNSASYSFVCPNCGTAVVKPAEPRIVELLVDAGCKIFNWTLPAELSEPRSGAPIGHDELLDFHDALLDEDAVWRELSGGE